MTASVVPLAAGLWAAVDKLTQPTTRTLLRDNEPAEVSDAVSEIRRQDKAEKLCRNQLGRYAAMQRRHAVVPSLWDQSTDALTTGSADQAEGKSGSVHRTPCDLTLMETRADIREAVELQLQGRSIKPRGTVPEQMRQLAAFVVTNEPQHVEWWEFRFAQWARVLAVYLQAVQAQPKPRRIRGVACPECKATTVLVEDAFGEMVNVPPIVVDFHDGLMRAAECTACATTLAWRGEEMWELADRLGQQEPA